MLILLYGDFELILSLQPSAMLGSASKAPSGSMMPGIFLLGYIFRFFSLSLFFSNSVAVIEQMQLSP